MSIIPESAFGRRVRDRLRAEQVIWLTTTGATGRPQPNPVWFLWEEPADTLLVYNHIRAHRLAHLAERPDVALNFNCDGRGEDVVVFAAHAGPATDAPPNSENVPYLAKYADGIARIGSDLQKFAQDYAEAVRIRLVKVRGF